MTMTMNEPMTTPDLFCPKCEKPVRRKGSYRLNPDDKRPAAILADGTCWTCWDKMKRADGRKRIRVVGTSRRNREPRPELTDADYERLRQSIRNMERSRAARGIPLDGIDPDVWAYGNGGLYASEIPGSSAGFSTGSSRPL